MLFDELSFRDEAGRNRFQQRYAFLGANDARLRHTPVLHVEAQKNSAPNIKVQLLLLNK